MNVNLKVLTGAQTGNIRSIGSKTVWISQDENEHISVSSSSPGNVPKSAVLTKVDNAWEFEPRTGNEWHVGGQKVALFSKTRIKSGSAIRLSWMGPDLNFAIGEKVAEVWPKPEPKKENKAKSKQDSSSADNHQKEPVPPQPSPLPVDPVQPEQAKPAPVQNSKSFSAHFSPTFGKGDRNWIPIAILASVILAGTGTVGVQYSQRQVAMKEAQAKEKEAEARQKEAEANLAQANADKANADANLAKEITDLEEMMENNRRELLELIISKRDQDKLNAEADLQKVAKDRKDVKDGLAEDTTLIDRTITKMKIREKNRQVAIQGFDGPPRPPLDLNLVGKRVAKLANHKKKKLMELISGPIEANLGSIASGKGLNVLLGKLGPLAAEQELELAELRADVRDLKKIIATQIQVPIPSVGFSEAELELESKEFAIELLEGLQGRDLPERAKRLFFKGGPYDSSVRHDSQNEPLHINWRFFEFLDGFEFDTEKRAIETYKRSALKEIEEGKLVSPDTLLKLWKARDRFTLILMKHRQEHVTPLPYEHHQQQAFDFARQEHKKMLRDLKILNDINSLDYLKPSETFEGKTINDLLAYMSRNSLEFEEKLNGGSQATREDNALIYNQMLDYQFAMLAVQVAAQSQGQADTSHLKETKDKLVSSAERELNRLNSKEDMLLDVKYDNYLKLAREAQARNPDRSFGDVLADVLIEGVKGFANGYGNGWGERASGVRDQHGD